LLLSQAEAFEQEKNGRLLHKLCLEFDAFGIGSINNFFSVTERWRCPSCHRSKPQFARLDKNNELLCAIHEHHDHFIDCVSRHLRDQRELDPSIVHSWEQSLIRFYNTLICNDCNVVEPHAKKVAGAPAQFSFAPYEIASFIIVQENRPHQLDYEKVREVYEAALPSMRIVADRLRAITLTKSKQDGTMLALGHVANRVLSDANIARKSSKNSLKSHPSASNQVKSGSIKP